MNFPVSLTVLARRSPPAPTVVDGVFSIADPDGSIRSIFVPSKDARRAGNAKPRRMQTRPAVDAGDRHADLHSCAIQGAAAGGLGGFQAPRRCRQRHLSLVVRDRRPGSIPRRCPMGDDVFFGSDDGHLYKVDVDSGVLIWEFITGDKIRGAPALSGGRVFVASWDGFLYAVESDSGRLAWKMPIAKFTRATPAVQGNKVFIGDEGGAMHCFDAATGRELWAAAARRLHLVLPCGDAAWRGFCQRTGNRRVHESRTAR